METTEDGGTARRVAEAKVICGRCNASNKE